MKYNAIEKNICSKTTTKDERNWSRKRKQEHLIWKFSNNEISA